MGSKLTDNEAFSESGGLAAGANVIGVEFAPSAELFVKQGAYSSYAPTAERAVSGIANTIHETGSYSVGRDMIETGFMVGNNSQVHIEAPEQMWDLLENVVNSGVESQRQALAAYDRITDNSLAVSIPDVAAASAAILPESKANTAARAAAAANPISKKALLIGGGVVLLFLNRKAIAKAF